MEKLAHHALGASHALARAHGHEWAHSLDLADVDRIARLCSTWEEAVADIAALTDERGDPNWVGIRAPDVLLNAGGWTIVHTTGSRRISWRINRRYGVEIDVCRPAGRVLAVSIPIRDDGTYGGVAVSRYSLLGSYGSDDLYERHLESLRVCLRALGVEAELPEAKPDPESQVAL